MTATESWWVRSAPDAEGVYRCEVSHGPDHAVFLSSAAADAYAGLALYVAEQAEYDAVILAELQRIGVDRLLAATTVLELRADRTGGGLGELAGTVVRAAATVAGKPFVVVDPDGPDPGQLDVAALRSHAAAVLSAVIVARLDNQYYRHLTGTVGADDQRARAAIAALGEARPT